MTREIDMGKYVAGQSCVGCGENEVFLALVFEFDEASNFEYETAHIVVEHIPTDEHGAPLPTPYLVVCSKEEWHKKNSLPKK